MFAVTASALRLWIGDTGTDTGAETSAAGLANPRTTDIQALLVQAARAATLHLDRRTGDACSVAPLPDDLRALDELSPVLAAEGCEVGARTHAPGLAPATRCC